jgi:hypothetical protein
MYDEVRKTEQAGPRSLFREGMNGPLKERRIGRGEVDKVAGMRRHRADAGGRPGLGKGRNCLLGQGPGAPLIGIFGKELDAITPQPSPARKGQRGTTGNGEVRPEQPCRLG